MKNTDIAVLGHADGICHTYVDKTADLKMAVEIASDAKIQCVAVCCSVAHVVAVCCMLLQCVESASDAKIQCVAVCCSVAHVVAVCRILFQCVVRAVTRCSVLQQLGQLSVQAKDLQQ